MFYLTSFYLGCGNLVYVMEHIKYNFFFCQYFVLGALADMFT